MWCSAADSHLKLLDRVVRSADFLAGGVLNCNLAHRLSVAELCMLFKIKSNPMHPLSSALSLPYVPAHATPGALVAHRHSFALLVVGLLSIAEPLCPSRCLFGTILVTLCLMMWDWRVSRAEPMLSCWHDLLLLWCLLLFYLLLPSMGWLCGVGVFGLIECPHSLPALHSGLQIIIIWVHSEIYRTAQDHRPRAAPCTLEGPCIPEASRTRIWFLGLSLVVYPGRNCP